MRPAATRVARTADWRARSCGGALASGAVLGVAASVMLASVLHLCAAAAGRTYMIDAFLASSEIDMVRYRLRLHESLAVRTIIAEAAFTHAGQPKPLLVQQSLSGDEIRRHNIRLVQITFTSEALQQARCRFPSLAAKQPVEDGSRSHSKSDGSSVHDQELHVSIHVNRSVCARIHTSASGGAGDTKSLLEGQQRRALNAAIREEIVALNASTLLLDARAEARATGQRVPFFVHVSDVDELLDPRLVAKQQVAWPNCLPAQ